MLRSLALSAVKPRCSLLLVTLSHNNSSAKRHYCNALVRKPPLQTIPTHSPSGEEVDGELLLSQVDKMLDALRMTALIEHVHSMRSTPYYEGFFTNDLLFQHYDLIIPMPKFGRENRSSETSETLRHMRACGASGDVNHVLQDAKGAICSGNDFVATKYAVYVGFGNATCNRVTAEVLKGAKAPDSGAAKVVQALNFYPIELPPESPPLGELVSFAGSRTFIVSDCEFGREAVEKMVALTPSVNWQVVFVEKGCSVLSFLGGAREVFDVVCDEDFIKSLNVIGECGLNPFAVPWSEPRKLGISMKRVVLIGRFARGTMSGGGYANSFGSQHTQYNYNSANMSKNSKLFANGHRVHGDYGGSFESQVRSGELYTPSYQTPPRYRAPMQRGGMNIVPKE